MIYDEHKQKTYPLYKNRTVAFRTFIDRRFPRKSNIPFIVLRYLPPVTTKQCFGTVLLDLYFIAFVIFVTSGVGICEHAN